MSRLLAFALCLSLLALISAFDNTRFDNLAVYYGQNSYGATHTDAAGMQQNLTVYCADNSIDAFPFAFMTTYFGPGGVPEINLANTCNNVDFPVFPGTELANCQFMASQIQSCQAKGKIITLSLGGATGSNVFTSDSQASAFADQVWNIFLGGNSSTRPFGGAVLDGVDLDIEGGGTDHYAAFINQLRNHFASASKRYYITAAPQCPFPDGNLATVLNSAWFDAVYIQFYNNFCGLQNFNIANDWNYGIWDNWATTTSINKNVKLYIGAPASPTAAGSGYVSVTQLAQVAAQIRHSFPSFGGVMLWDASQAFSNGRFDAAIKQSLVAQGGTGFTPPPCSNFPAFQVGAQYSAGSEVSFQGYIWEAKFFASSTPSSSVNGEWTAVSVCSGTGSTSTISSTPPSTSSTSKSTTSNPTTSKPTTTSTSTQPTATSGNCAGVPAWVSTVAYTAGQQVVSGGHLWTAKWWSQADVPGGPAGDWTDNGPCR